MKKITIKSTVLSAAMIIIVSTGTTVQAGVFDQLAAVAVSTLPAYGRVQTMSAAKSGLESEQIVEAGIREAIVVASDRVVAKGNTLPADELRLSADMRRAQKMAVKLGYEESFNVLTEQVNEALIAAVPATGELLKAAAARVELDQPLSLLTSHETATTDFLRHRVSASLQRELQPLVQVLLEDAGAASTSAKLGLDIQFGTLLDTIVSNHVIQQSIDGFFDQLELEESAIRQNPESRTTRLLQRVFG